MAGASALTVTTPQWRPYAFLAAGILVGSIGVIFIRMAQLEQVPSLVIVTLRLILATALLTPLVLTRYRHELRRLSRRDLLLAAFAGVNFGVQIVTGFESLNHTTVLVAGVIGASVPLWVAVMERVFLRTRINQYVRNGMILALVGSFIIALSGLNQGVGNDLFLGGGLALTSAFMTAGYFIVVRSVRLRVSFFPFTWMICGLGAITCLVIVMVTRTPLTGYSIEGYFWIILITLGPQLIVQSSYTYTLAYFSPTFLSITTQLVTVGNAVAVYIVFNQIPAPIQIVGSVVILAGILLTNLGQTRSARTVAAGESTRRASQAEVLSISPGADTARSP